MGKQLKEQKCECFAIRHVGFGSGLGTRAGPRLTRRTCNSVSLKIDEQTLKYRTARERDEEGEEEMEIQLLLSSFVPYECSKCPSKFTKQSLIRNPNLSLNPPFWVSENNNKKKLFTLKCRRSDYFEQQDQRFSRGSSDNSFARHSVGGFPPKVFVGHSVYKGKAALTVEPKGPEFAPLDSGAFKVSRDGYVLLQFAPGVGARQYDWSRKQVFSLSVTEIGTLMGLGARDSCEFFHDPFKGKSDEGKVRKVLRVEPLPDGSGHFFNLSVQNKLMNVDESIYIPITKAEFTVLVSAFNFILPYLMGWHTFADSIRPEDAGRLNNTNSQGGAELEWSR